MQNGGNICVLISVNNKEFLIILSLNIKFSIKLKHKNI